MLTIGDYKEPTSHPFGMLSNYEEESFMAWFLSKCIEEGDLDASIKTVVNEDHMCSPSIGMLLKVSSQTYKLTTKAKGLLYAHYGV